MPVINRSPVNVDDDEYYQALVERQAKAGKNHDTCRDYNSIHIGVYCKGSLRRLSTMDPLSIYRQR